MNRRQRDKPQPEFAGYCDQWGYRPDSAVGRLIDHLREDHRVKYGSNYQLERTGKNQFQVLPGDNGSGDFWQSSVLEHGAEFGVTLHATP